MSDDTESVECSACDDTGWRVVDCDGVSHAIGAPCGRRRRHLPHEFVKKCECRPMNRRFQEKFATQQRVA